MRAWQYTQTGPAEEVLRCAELPDPMPGPGDVRVALHASGINPHDTKKRSGWLGADAVPEGGVIPHSDGAGVIDAVGPGADPARRGERVFVLHAPPARGTAAEYVVIGADWAIPLPDGISFEAGACLGVPAFTAWLAVLGDGPVTGKTVVVHGAGSVGRVAIELAAWNAARVIVTAGSPESQRIAAAKGADVVLDRHADDIVERVAELTGGGGADRVIDVDFGANNRVDAAILAEHGVVASYSATGDPTPTLPYYAFAMKGATLRFIQVTRIAPDTRDRAARTICALLERGRLQPDIVARYPFEAAAQAHDAVESGAGGNVVLDVPPSY